MHTTVPLSPARPLITRRQAPVPTTRMPRNPTTQKMQAKRTYCCLGGAEGLCRGSDNAYYEMERAHKTIRRLDGGATVLFEGDVATEFFTVHSGWAFGYTLLEDGSRQILNVYLPGDSIGVQAFFGKPMDYSVEAIGPLQLCVFGAPRLREAARTATSLHDLVLQRLDAERISLQHRLITVGRRSSAKKLAYLLHDLFTRLEARNLTYGKTCVIPLTQTLMADALGLSPEYLNRLLKQLRNENLVSLNRGKMMLHDRDGLARFASAGDGE